MSPDIAMLKHSSNNLITLTTKLFNCSYHLKKLIAQLMANWRPFCFRVGSFNAYELLTCYHLCICVLFIPLFATMCAIVANEGNLSGITFFVWGPFSFDCKKIPRGCRRWHPADLGSGHVQVI